jgi:hypothetical protein
MYAWFVVMGTFFYLLIYFSQIDLLNMSFLIIVLLNFYFDYYRDIYYNDLSNLTF